MDRFTVLFFHPAGLFYGGTEKLLQVMAKYCATDCRVIFAYAPQDGQQQKNYFQGTGVILAPFEYSRKQTTEPYALLGMRPAFRALLDTYSVDLVVTPVYSHYQFPLSSVSAAMPFIITSPFGHYATNGNVAKVFVSGSKNLERLRRRGISTAELIMDPIEDFPSWVWQRLPVGQRVVFGRVGRPDDNIFDPVALRAFAQLESKYPDRVLYRVLQPPPKMVSLARELNVQNIEFVYDQESGYLERFYHSIDVMAHFRYDGETFGKAIAEGMMSGLPIVTHTSHYNNEHVRLLNESFARISGPDDVASYLAGLDYFVTHKDAIRAMGQLARVKALEAVVLPPNSLIFSMSSKKRPRVAGIKIAFREWLAIDLCSSKN